MEFEKEKGIKKSKNYANNIENVEAIPLEPPRRRGRPRKVVPQGELIPSMDYDQRNVFHRAPIEADPSFSNSADYFPHIETILPRLNDNFDNIPNHDGNDVVQPAVTYTPDIPQRTVIIDSYGNEVWESAPNPELIPYEPINEPIQEAVYFPTNQGLMPLTTFHPNNFIVASSDPLIDDTNDGNNLSMLTNNITLYDEFVTSNQMFWNNDVEENL